MLILGISAFFHDSAACLVEDGKILSAVQEERFTRIKHDASFPHHAILACLRAAGRSIEDVELVVFYEKPHRKFSRIITTAGRSFPKGFAVFQQALSLWWKEKLWVDRRIIHGIHNISPTNGQVMRWDGRPMFCDHHISHAASAFYPSPFEEAAIVVVDGVGEWATTTIWNGHDNTRSIPEVELLRSIDYPDSLGLLYSAMTAFLGFKVNSGEYKVMGLAAYGQPRYEKQIRDHLINLRDDGSFSIRLKNFRYTNDLTMFQKKHWEQIFGIKARTTEAKLTQDHMDIAASVQAVVENAMLGIAREAHHLTGHKALCLAGGVALNCVANGRILREGPFSDVWIQPAAGDAGGAVGAALWAWHSVCENKKINDHDEDYMRGSLLGTSHDDADILETFKKWKIEPEILENEAVAKRAAQEIAEGRVIGFFQGPMEFGPRSLGARSILADPRSEVAQRTVNLKVKFRESFRPFAPAILRERVNEWFELDGHKDSHLGEKGKGYGSPYMLLVASVSKDKRLAIPKEAEGLFGIDLLNIPRSKIPACTHVDYSARVQTVDGKHNPIFYDLIYEFDKLTGVPVVLNTSFNVRGEPIVCTPDDAVRCFLGTGIDTLMIGNFLVRRENVDAEIIAQMANYEEAFQLD